MDGSGLTMLVSVADASAIATSTNTYNASVGSATGGSFTLTVDGFTTLPIAWNALAADVQTALGALASSVSGTGPWVITFVSAPTSVSIDGTGLLQPSMGATATAYGGVDQVLVEAGGFGYTFPTVDFDMPDDPNGVQTKGHIASIALGDAFDGLLPDGLITYNGVVVD